MIETFSSPLNETSFTVYNMLTEADALQLDSFDAVSEYRSNYLLAYFEYFDAKNFHTFSPLVLFFDSSTYRERSRMLG